MHIQVRTQNHQPLLIMSTHKRILRYDQAITEATFECMERDPNVFIIGQGVKSPWYVGSTTKGIQDKFGVTRLIDTPVSENAILGTGIGASLIGLRPIIVFPRMDFMMYAMEQLADELNNIHYMFGGAMTAPVVVRSIINRGGEQAAQHSQALHAFFAHLPGIKVVMPASAYDAKGLLVAAIEDENPVMYIDDRWLYDISDSVPKEHYTVPIGKARIRTKGNDITVVAVSYLVPEAIHASEILAKDGINIEVIDPRTIKPLDTKTIICSVKKTGRLIIADVGWKDFGISGEISSQVHEMAFKYLKTPIVRIALPNTPAPMSKTLENKYYPRYTDIINAARALLT